MNRKVDGYIKKSTRWQPELEKLRAIALGRPLVEELKWGVPCYTFQGSNIVLIHEFKEYCALLFFKGALLKDSNRILIQQTKNVQSGRQIRFTSVRQITDLQTVVSAYIDEAIEVEKAGLKVELKRTSEFKVPIELKKRLDENDSLKVAFGALTPGRQRAYLLHFAAAKQSKTRESRIENCIPQILQGKGLRD